ncbi:hypothetical protein [Roseateles sp.]|jgi:hypothetical protein|uniref:hypothetical protein n=1 Tax=Roseateles sp. TaxID=1971397 RepID=UPI0037C91E0F
MNAVLGLFALVSTALAAATAGAQFVKGNEAFQVMPDGSRVAETQPLPTASLGAPCPAAKSGCAGCGWKMLESQSGLVECTEVFARPGNCRESTYGTAKRSRVWIVKLKGEWMQCERPDITGKCISLRGYPISAVQ